MIEKEQLNYLKNSEKDLEDFSFKNHECYAKCVDVYDGDTCRFKFFYKNILFQYPCRMKGYNSWEIKPKKNNRTEESIHKEKELAEKAKKRLIELLNNKKKLVYIKFEDFDKYGRPLITAYADKDELKSINDIMIEENHGKPYEGGTKPEFDE